MASQPIGIAGWKNSGKTTLIARLIPALAARGLSVSTIKHVHHSIDLDQPGKDTYWHREAGAVDVLMFSGSRWALLHERRGEPDPAPDLSDLIRHMQPVDLVLVEGFKNLPIPKIEVRADGSDPPIVDQHTLAVVTDGRPEPNLPTFRRNDIAGLAEFLAETVTGRPARLAVLEQNAS